MSSRMFWILSVLCLYSISGHTQDVEKRQGSDILYHSSLLAIFDDAFLEAMFPDPNYAWYNDYSNNLRCGGPSCEPVDLDTPPAELRPVIAYLNDELAHIRNDFSGVQTFIPYVYEDTYYQLKRNLHILLLQLLRDNGMEAYTVANGSDLVKDNAYFHDLKPLLSGVLLADHPNIPNQGYQSCIEFCNPDVSSANCSNTTGSRGRGWYTHPQTLVEIAQGIHDELWDYEQITGRHIALGVNFGPQSSDDEFQQYLTEIHPEEGQTITSYLDFVAFSVFGNMSLSDNDGDSFECTMVDLSAAIDALPAALQTGFRPVFGGAYENTSAATISYQKFNAQNYPSMYWSQTPADLPGSVVQASPDTLYRGRLYPVDGMTGGPDSYYMVHSADFDHPEAWLRTLPHAITNATTDVTITNVSANGNTLSIEVTNHFEGPTNPRFWLEIREDGVVINGPRPFITLTANQTTIQQDLDLYGSGLAKLDISLVMDTDIDDLESNNSVTYFHQISPGLPDLALSSITPQTPIEQVTESGHYLFDVKVKNKGLGNSPISTIHLETDGPGVFDMTKTGKTTYANAQVPALAPGQTYTASISIFVELGNKTIKASIDEDNSVAEIDENNNDKSIPYALPAPDLGLDAIQVSNLQPTVGEAVTINVQVSNIGNADYDAATGAEIFLKVDGVGIGSLYIPSMATSQTLTLGGFTWTPSSSGTHQIEASIDGSLLGDWEIYDPENPNNQISKTISVTTNQADLTVADITPSNQTPNSGEAMDFVVKIKNKGLAYSPSGLPVGLYAENTLIGSFELPSLSPGNVAYHTLSWTTGSDGPITIKAIVDPNDILPESNESNNEKQISLNVGNTLLPDLYLDDVTLSTTTPSPGQTVTLNATIYNGGPGSTPVNEYVGYNFKLDGVEIGSDHYEDGTNPIVLAPGESWSFTRAITWPNDQNSHTVTLTTDPNNNINETSETNNTATIYAGGGSDLIITNVSFSPANPEVGDTVSLVATVKNIGNAPTPYGVTVGVGFVANNRNNGWFTVKDANGSVKGLEPGESYTGTSHIQWTRTYAYEIKAIADDVNRFQEISETNNEKILTNMASQ